MIRLGLRRFSVEQFAEMLREALPDVLTREKAQQAAGELVENAARLQFGYWLGLRAKGCPVALALWPGDHSVTIPFWKAAPGPKLLARP